MDPNSLISLAQGLLLLVFVLVSLNLYLVFRLKDIDPFKSWNPNSINPLIFIVFFVIGIVGTVYLGYTYWDKLILVTNPASAHGVLIDNMFWWTMGISLFVVLVTNTLLFYFSWKYRNTKERKAVHYADNHRAEQIWTIIPAIVMTILVFRGCTVWNDITAPAPTEALHIEMMGKQFDWTFRYPGTDGEFGEYKARYIDDATANSLGIRLDDKAGHDDLITTELHLPVNKPVEFTIRSRDVLHSATLAHFRMKMDAVPGMTTRFWLTPTKTTAEMKEIKGEDFEYEMSCQQICGASHWNMRRVVIVESWEDYQAWLAEQQTFRSVYEMVNGEGAIAEIMNDKATDDLAANE